jgi:TRAP-type C4-dicarboxylate transport system substrate-binding protein
MKFHTDTQFYSAAFFIVMNPAKYASFPPDVKAAIDELSGLAWVAKFGPLWDKWDRPVRQGAAAPEHEIIVPDREAMAEWRRELQPVTDRYLDELTRSFPNARVAYDKLLAMVRR